MRLCHSYEPGILPSPPGTPDLDRSTGDRTPVLPRFRDTRLRPMGAIDLGHPRGMAYRHLYRRWIDRSVARREIIPRNLREHPVDRSLGMNPRRIEERDAVMDL